MLCIYCVSGGLLMICGLFGEDLIKPMAFGVEGLICWASFYLGHRSIHFTQPKACRIYCASANCNAIFYTRPWELVENTMQIVFKVNTAQVDKKSHLTKL
jgi:hypothetical protein